MVSLASSTRGHIDMKYCVWCGSEGDVGDAKRLQTVRQYEIAVAPIDYCRLGKHRTTWPTPQTIFQ